MNHLYYQNILLKEFICLINKESTCATHITEVQAVRELLDMGLDLNTSITSERLGQQHTQSLMEYALSQGYDHQILCIALSEVTSEHFQQMSYASQCNCMDSILNKPWTSDIKTVLIEILFDKGFVLKPHDQLSPEIEWLTSGHIEFLEVLIQRQGHPDWLHDYANHVHYPGYATAFKDRSDTPHTLLWEIEQAIDTTAHNLSSRHRNELLTRLSEIHQKISRLTQYQHLHTQLCENEEAKGTTCKI